MKPESLLELPVDQNCGTSDDQPNDSQLQEVAEDHPDEEKIESSDAQDVENDHEDENLDEIENIHDDDDDDDDDDDATKDDGNANDDDDDDAANDDGKANDDDDDYEDLYQLKEQDTTELIEEATAAALNDAIAMKRSDSVLSEESGVKSVTSEDELEETTIPHDVPLASPLAGTSNRRISRASARYMEEASFEASLVGPNHHHLAPSGRIGRQHTESKTEDVDVMMSVNSLDSLLEDAKLSDGEEESVDDKGFGTERRRSERGVFQGCESKDGDDFPPLATIHSGPSDDTDSGSAASNDLPKVLDACGLLKPSESSRYADDVVLLHAIFQDFCQPPLDIESVERVLEMERGLDHRAIALPMDVMIHKPSEVLVELLGPPILRVPEEFALGLFRILLRLLTGDNDAEHNREMLTSCSWYNDTFTSEPMDPQTMLTRQRTHSTSSLKRQDSFSDKSFNRGSAARKAGQMYNMVRLQRKWSGAVGQVCSLLDTLLENDKYDYLLAPVIRFLGLLCTGGVSVDELRHMLFLANEGTPNPKARLLLVRALKVATEGASRSSVLIGKASPRSFFSFGYCEGLRRTISLEKSPWPFRNDFGMALWFRAEHFSESSVLFRAEDGSGSGIEVSLLPLDSISTSATTPTVLAVSTLSEGKPSQFIMVRSCLLLPRVWYHVAIRHTRSRLKGVFSLASREQVSIMLDGKTMVTEPLKFPKIKESKTSELTLTLAKKFDGQTGALYVFHDNVSDATFRALYEVTAGTSGVVQKRASAHDEWDSRRGVIAKKSKMLDLNMRRDDVENIVLVQKTTTKEASSVVVDLESGDESFDNNPLSKAAFSSRVYLVWDPRRTIGDMALELHSGAHARMESENVRPWLVEGAQDVVSSIGGVQALLPVFRALLSGDIEKSWVNSASNVIGSSLYDNSVLCSLVPDLFSLLASFLREHNENAREMLRCGGIDIIEQLLQQNKKLGEEGLRPPSGSLVSSLSVFSSLSNLLMDSLLELRSACSHYGGLETKVFARLLFNLPLWFGGLGPGIALYPTLLPVLSSVTRSNPEKVRDCVGTKYMIQLLKEVMESENKGSFEKSHVPFERETKEWRDLNTSLTVFECRHVADVVLGMVFQVLGLGETQEGLSQFLHLISYYLEAEWEQASKEVSAGVQAANRSGLREERYIFTVKASTILLLLLQTRPPIPNFYESFAASCGGIQGGAAWLLSALVNSHCDQIRSIGVRCVVSYIERTSRSPDSPLSLDRPITSDLDKSKASGMDARTLQANTLSLISNVGQGALISNVARGLAAIGPSVRSALLTPSKLTPRVVYKLLWHLLKSHRYRMRDKTQSSLIRMVFEDSASSPSQLPSYEFLRDHFIKVDNIFGNGVSIDMGWVDGILSNMDFDHQKSIQNTLAIGILMRLLRFLPTKFTDQWLSHILQFVSTDLSAVDILSTCPDWQPCLFQFISETIEQSTSSISFHLQLPSGDKTEPGAPHVAGDLSPPISTHDPENGIRMIDQGQPVSTHSQNDLALLNGRLDKSLDLYATLLGHCIREGGDKALRAVEDAASLQRVCLNGNETFTLILSRLLSNLSAYGTIPFGEPAELSSKGESGEPSDLLKRSARLVTEAILSNGTDGLNMAAAVGCWRCLRHLTALAVAVVTKSGFGVADLFDYRNQSASAIDNISGGLHGIRLPEDGVAAIRAEDLIAYHEDLGSQGKVYSEEEDEAINTLRERIIFRRMCVTIAAQLLSLLDVFIFPDSLDASLPASQLHGLALVRSTETRIGTAQGPLLASGIRLSLLLLCQLEPCSVKFLQCSSRLRCFLHWSLELVRESEALEGYSSAFNVLTAPTDRLILAVVLQCHRALGRCGALLSEIESSSVEKYFDSKESQKKYYRRLLRVVLELRDIILTSYKGRNEVLRTSLSPESFEALQSCLEVPSLPTEEPASPSPGKTASPKETMVRTLLSSSWITRFQDVDIRDNIAIPEQLELGNKTQQLDSTSRGALAVEELVTESSAIVGNFEKALNICFEKYLEAQRIWSETGAVRDLEFEGDTTLKRLSGRHRFDLIEVGKQLTLRSTAADIRWKGIDRNIVDIWEKGLHWRLARYTDRLGRRILLVHHRQFVDRQQASYELLMGMEREKEERGRDERFRKKQELAELMKRNTDAFVPYGGAENPLDIEDEERDQEETGIDSELENGDYTESETETTFDESLADGLDEKKADHDESKIKDDIDAWARTFIWSDNESVVARFETVMVVTLQNFVEGKLLLTTHGLYFHQTRNEVNMMARETADMSDVNQQLGLEANDRRWRLSRVTEVLGRRYMLRAQAIELFFSDSHELFLNFLGGTKERDRFYAKLKNSCKVPMLFSPKSLHPRAAFKKSKLTELWKKRKISNFEYLMALNKMAGRTFNDIAQYPVFPWILSDYTSETIDLTDSRVYRDLTKPVGALNPNRLAQLIERYNELEEFGFAASEKFLFGSHYSAPGVILHYLIRQEPFTSMAIDLQSGRFDCPDRLFFDLAESWKSCNTSSSDVKELIPEFFTLPEMLLNTNKFPLGHTQRGRLVDNVGLPPWAKGCAHEFVRIHRLALESEYVSQNLNHWIDLVFGYQQRGPEAEAAHNLFHHLSYEGSVDLDKISDELDRKAAESHIQNFGQTPSQLLVKEPHPNRNAAEECWKPLIHTVKAAQTLRCYTPSKQFGGKKAGPGAALKIHVQADSILVIYSDLSVGTYKWTPKNASNKLKPEKLRPLPNRDVSNSRSVIKRGSAAPQTMNDSGSSLAIGNWSFAFTLGGYEKEQQRRKAVMPSRLASAKDALYTEASALTVSCGYWDNTVKVHSMDAWRLECSDTGGHRGPIRCLGIGQDGGLLVTGGQDSTCRVWVVDHPDMAFALADGYVQTAIGQSNDGEQVLSCCHVLWGHETPITCLDLSSDLDVTVSGSMGGLVCVHTVRRGEFVRSITPPSDSQSPVTRLALDSHGRMAVHLDDHGLHTYTINGVRLCSVDAGERLHDMKITGETLVTGGDSCHVYIRNITNLKVLSMLDLSRHGPIRCISLTPSELNPTPQFLFIGSDDGMITIVDKEDEKKNP